MNRISNSIMLFCITALVSSCSGYYAYQRAQEQYRDGNFQEAYASVEEAKKHDPENVQYRVSSTIIKNSTSLDFQNKIKERLNLKDYVEADRLIAQGLQFNPNDDALLLLKKQTINERSAQQYLAQATNLFQSKGIEASSEILALVKKILDLQPSLDQAILLRNQVQDAKQRASDPDSILAQLLNTPVTMTVDNLPIRNILSKIATQLSLNIYYDKDLRESPLTPFSVKDLPAKSALTLLLTANGLSYQPLNANSIIIYQNNPTKHKQYQRSMIRAFYLNYAEANLVAGYLRSLLRVNDVVVDVRLNMVVLRDSIQVIRIADKLIELLDIADPEVLLEVEILEVKKQSILNLGIQWPTQIGLTPMLRGGAPLTLNNIDGIGAKDLRVGLSTSAINFLKQDSDTNILSNPKIRVINNEKAKILIGDKVPVITTTVNPTGGSVSESVSYLDVGLKLEVKPTIQQNADVEIVISLEVSSIVKQITSANGTSSYQIGTRDASTTLRLKNNETEILAGLISDQEISNANKIPGFGDIPILGRLFGSNNNDKTRTEIVLSITPRILRAIDRKTLLDTQFPTGTDNDLSAFESYLDSLILSK
ncbi:MAG: hypothetical protein QM538_07225 [Methylacidiphilales bacterium]|nr:hypothetical protein [Candidatus Methylacidiphilales bacterium]